MSQSDSKDCASASDASTKNALNENYQTLIDSVFMVGYDDKTTKEVAEYKKVLPVVDIIVVASVEDCPVNYHILNRTRCQIDISVRTGKFFSLRNNNLICYKLAGDDYGVNTHHKYPLPVVDVNLVKMGEECPEGSHLIGTTYNNVSRANLTGGEKDSDALFLCYTRASSHYVNAALTDLMLIKDVDVETTKNFPVGYTKVHPGRTFNTGLLTPKICLLKKISVLRHGIVNLPASILQTLSVNNDTGKVFEVEKHLCTFVLPNSVEVFCLPCEVSTNTTTTTTTTTTTNNGSEKKNSSTFRKYKISNSIVYTREMRKIFCYSYMFEEAMPAETVEKLGMHKKINNYENYTFYWTKYLLVTSLYPCEEVCMSLFSTVAQFMWNVNNRQHSFNLMSVIGYFLKVPIVPTDDNIRVVLNLPDNFNKNITQANPVEYQMKRTDRTLKRSPNLFLKLLCNFSENEICNLLAALLMEEKILVHSNYQKKVSEFCETLTSMVLPFEWVCPYLPYCPREYFQSTQSPTPFIIGVMDEYFAEYKVDKDVICVNLDTNTIVYSEEFFPKSDGSLKNICLPQAFESLRYKIVCLVNEINGIIKNSGTTVCQGNFHAVQAVLGWEITAKAQEILQGNFFNTVGKLIVGFDEFVPNLYSFERDRFLQSRIFTDRKFYDAFTKTQMFWDFIYRWSSNRRYRDLGRSVSFAPVTLTTTKSNSSENTAEKKSKPKVEPLMLVAFDSLIKDETNNSDEIIVKTNLTENFELKFDVDFFNTVTSEIDKNLPEEYKNKDCLVDGSIEQYVFLTKMANINDLLATYNFDRDLMADSNYLKSTNEKMITKKTVLFLTSNIVKSWCAVLVVTCKGVLDFFRELKFSISYESVNMKAQVMDRIFFNIGNWFINTLAELKFKQKLDISLRKHLTVTEAEGENSQVDDDKKNTNFIMAAADTIFSLCRSENAEKLQQRFFRVVNNENNNESGANLSTNSLQPCGGLNMRRFVEHIENVNAPTNNSQAEEKVCQVYFSVLASCNMCGVTMSEFEISSQTLLGRKVSCVRCRKVDGLQQELFPLLEVAIVDKATNKIVLHKHTPYFSFHDVNRKLFKILKNNQKREEFYSQVSLTGTFSSVRPNLFWNMLAQFARHDLISSLPLNIQNFNYAQLTFLHHRHLNFLNKNDPFVLFHNDPLKLLENSAIRIEGSNLINNFFKCAKVKDFKQFFDALQITNKKHYQVDIYSKGNFWNIAEQALLLFKIIKKTGKLNVLLDKFMHDGKGAFCEFWRDEKNIMQLYIYIEHFDSVSVSYPEHMSDWGDILT